MNLRAAALIPFLTLGAALSAQSQEAPLTWDACAKEALAHNADLQKARFTLLSARYDKKGSFNSFLPSLSASASANKSGDAGSLRAIFREDTGTQYQMGLSASINLFNGFQDKASWDAASLAERQAAVQYQQARATLSNSLRNAFTNLLYAQQQVSLTEAIAARQKENVRMVDLRYESGRENKGSLLNTQAAASQAELEVTEAKRALRLAQRQLNNTLGRSEEGSPTVSGDLGTEDPGDAPDFGPLARSTFSYLLASLQFETAKVRVTSAKGEFLPSLNANASMGRSGSDWVPNQHSWGAGLSLSYPLFEGGRRVANLQSAQADRDAARASFTSAEQDAALSLESAYWDFRNALDSVKVQNEYLTATQAREEVAQAQYANGLISYQDWDTVESSLISREKSNLQSLRDAKKAEAAWKLALGKDELP